MTQPLSERKKLLTAANRAYAQGQPFMTDPEYDELWLSIRKEDPTHPELYHTGALPPSPGQHPHPIPMLSLDKVMELKQLNTFLTRHPTASLIAQPKYDGIAVALYPTPTDPGYRVVLAGNGFFGDDVTHCVTSVEHDTTLRLMVVNTSGIQCEAIIANADWDSRLGANPRNVASGMLNPKRKEQHEYVGLLTFIPHDYQAVPISRPRGTGAAAIWDQCLTHHAAFSALYPTDGIVLKVADLGARTRAGHNGVYPYWAVAWKPPISTADTRITSIEWNVSRTGRVVPTVNYEPVQLCGTSNTRATGNNAEWVAEMGLCNGTAIRIGKAGEIIPRILTNLDAETERYRPATLPRTCPVCGNPLHFDGVHLVCDNESGCMARTIRRVTFFYSTLGMDISGVGPATVEEFLKDHELYELFHDKPWALLHPTVYGLHTNFTEAIGHTNAEKIFAEVEKKLPLRNPADLLTAIGEEGLGRKSSLRLLQCMAGATVAKPHRPAVDAFIIAYPIFKGAVKELEEAGVELAPLPKPGKATVCITGTFPYTRDEMIQALETAGYEYASGMTKAVDFLLVGEIPGTKTNGTSKMRKAKRWNTPIRGEDFFLSLITSKESSNG